MRYLVVFLTLAATACTTYRIRSAEDHGGMKVVKLEIERTSNALFWAESEHQFWLCQDMGDDLVCHRSCGGDTDLQCPAVVVSNDGFITNTR